ncbi:MAG TPA: FkbM family methyltransferase [Vicinamibacterales bacterium]|nr:FkbM family methyltransferase [Vicinamibacterales bacterium]
MSQRARVHRLLHRVLPGFPVPIYVSPGFWFITRNDHLSSQVFAGSFETNECAAFASVLRPGMTVLDIGANVGFYSLLASRLIGPGGRVIAFEPSAREGRRLALHLRINGARNVTTEPFALGERNEEATFYVVEERDSGCNSFRPGDLGLPTTPVTVSVKRLDDCLPRGTRIDVVKIDVEGAELSALRGGEQMFRRDRPPVMCEIEEIRIAPWGYRGRDIVDLLAGWGYEWSAITEHGLRPLSGSESEFSGNFLARPR